MKIIFTTAFIISIVSASLLFPQTNSTAVWRLTESDTTSVNTTWKY